MHDAGDRTQDAGDGVSGKGRRQRPDLNASLVRKTASLEEPTRPDGTDLHPHTVLLRKWACALAGRPGQPLLCLGDTVTLIRSCPSLLQTGVSSTGCWLSTLHSCQRCWCLSPLVLSSPDSLA